MEKWKTRRPNYSELYPGVVIPGEVLQFLKQSDRRMEYLEYEIKRDRHARCKDGKRAKDSNGQPVALPELEVSLEKLMEEDWKFPANAISPEDEAIARIELDEVNRRLSLLCQRERELIGALFFSHGGKGMSDREYEKQSGIPRKTIAYRKAKILAKLNPDF